MPNHYRPLSATVLVGCLIAVVSCRPNLEPAPEARGDASTLTGTIVVGDISMRVRNKIQRLRPLVVHLGNGLGDFGIGRGEVKLTQDSDTMARYLASGEVDFFIDSYYPATVVANRIGATPSVLMRKHPGERTSIFFALRSSGLRTLDDLLGQTIALEDRASTTSFMLPKAHLLQVGFDLVENTSRYSTVGPDEIGYVVCADETIVIRWVVSGQVVAGVVDDVTFKKQLEEEGTDMIVLAETEKIIRHQPVVFRPGMDPSLEAAVRTQLLNLDKTLEGRAVLERLHASFSEISPQDEVLLRRARELYELVEGK